MDNSFVHCSFQPSYGTCDGWVSRPAKESPPLFSFALCNGVKQPLRIWETGFLSRQVKDRRGNSDRDWEGPAEEENLMGKSECSSGTVVVSLTYLLCATHETFSCSSRFFPRHLSGPPFSRLSPFPPPLLICRLFSQCWDWPTECFMSFFFSFMKKRALSIWSTLIKYKDEFTWEPVQQELVSPNMLLLLKHLMGCRQQSGQYRLGLKCR